MKKRTGPIEINSSYSEDLSQNNYAEITKLGNDVEVDSKLFEKLVDEEKEDVEYIHNTTPPNLINESTEVSSLRKRLHTLRLNPENIALLQQSIIKPPFTADECLELGTPEMISILMDTMDKAFYGNLPQLIFRALFDPEDYKDKTLMIISSATPGLMNDVVVPCQVPSEIHEQVLTKKMEETCTIVQLCEKILSDDAFLTKMPRNPRKKAKRKIPLDLKVSNYPTWTDDDLSIAVENVGARPRKSLKPTDDFDFRQKHEFNRGIEYILDSKPARYGSRVQLRGSQPPPWFPGYMMALSDIPDVVQVAKSPSQVLLSAWNSVQPNIFQDDSIIYN